MTCRWIGYPGLKSRSSQPTKIPSSSIGRVPSGRASGPFRPASAPWLHFVVDNDIASLAQFSRMRVQMASWKKSVFIDASPDQVFAYVDDPSKLVEWLPGMMEVHDVIGSGAGQQHEWTYKMAGVKLRGQAVVVEHILNTSAVHQTVGMIHSTFAYSVEPHDEGTRLSLDVEYTVPIPVLGKLAERLVIARNARELALALTNVKETLES
jgi:carbon monoxide dehydrogenase subunit G